MKVAVLTLPLHTNYGGNLQAYALMETLKLLECEPLFIRRAKERRSLKSWCVILLKRFIKCLKVRSFESLLPEFKESRETPFTNYYSEIFIKDWIIPSSVPIRSSGQLADVILESKMDAVIVGSDQVWRPSYAPNIYDYFLGFLSENKSIKKITYAASFGTRDWLFDTLQTERCSHLLREFDSVSVREDSAVTMCQERFGVIARHVLDPTMLIPLSLYRNVVTDKDLVKYNYSSISYVLDEADDVGRLMDHIDNYFNGELIRINSRIENKDAPLVERIAPSVSSWLASFMNSEYVVTDSFHACVFSILFNKKFFVYCNPKRGKSRFESLLKMFDLESRMISSIEDFDGIVEQEIDWSGVNQQVSLERENSLSYLRGALFGE
ncbi:MAG: hypothetical protein CMI00_06685 [Oceanospirillaceae bacterium]|nr:hypothetical protein [Oceanospirillaceae bacterium]|tara:strand:- start:1293 stop:2435 length:1143 start_codon:yes stop_codon:yes gene_type:complete